MPEQTLPPIEYAAEVDDNPTYYAVAFPRLWATVERDFGDLPLARRLQIAALATRAICGTCRDAETTCMCDPRYDI